jgi:hypothetical protein
MSEMTFDQHFLVFKGKNMKYIKNKLHQTIFANSSKPEITNKSKFEIITKSRRFLSLMFENPIKGGEVNGKLLAYTTFELVD